MILPWRYLSILTSGLMVAERISPLLGGFEVAGAGVYLPAAEVAFDHSVWGTVEEYGDARLERCRAFLPEFWGAIVALQAYWPCHLGIDNLKVVRSIGRLLDAGCLAKPLPLVKDGDLVALIQYMIRTRGRDTVRGLRRSRVMLMMMMFSMVRFDYLINRVMLRLILLLILVVVIKLKFLLMLGVGYFRLVVIGILF